MRAWFNYMFIVLVSVLCSASVALSVPKKTAFSAKNVVVQTATVEHDSSNQHCDQPDDTEVITAAYTQHHVSGPFIFLIYQGLKSANVPIVYTAGKPRRDKALIQPIYKLLLFPFHGFW